MKNLFTGSKSTGSDAHRTRWGVLGSSLAALALLAAPLVIDIGTHGASGLIGSANAAPGGVPGAPDDGGGGGGAPDFGDLIILYRDIDGVPIPSPVVDVEDPETGELVAGGQCWQPIAFPSQEGCEVVCDDPSVPCLVPVDQYSCGVLAPACTQEVNFGRINEARSPDEVFESQLEDVVVNLATADCRTIDPAGRLVATRVADDLSVLVSTIDSPLQNLAIYRQLMLTGTIGAPLPEGAGTLDTAARGLGTASDKSGGVNVDLVAYLNFIMGLSDPLTSTILPKLCESYREEVTGTIQLVEKCFLDYGQVPPGFIPYEYNRTANFGALPAPAYIPADDPLTPENESVDGWFEYLVQLDPVPTFGIEQGPILGAVFEDEPGDEGGNIGGFAQASDDTRAVISFMHENQVPVDFETPVPCVTDPNVIAYDVSISDVSGLQVPAQMVDGSEGREFFLTVANAGPDPASGTVTVTAIPENGGTIVGSPWTFEFTDLAADGSETWTTFFTIDLGERTTINWDAIAVAEFDVNPTNNTANATTSVKVTGGGGGGGKPN